MGLERAAVEGAGTGAKFSDVIAAHAGKAGLKVVVKSPDMVMVPYALDGGRAQNCFVTYLGKDGDGANIIAIFSPSLKMPKDQELGAKTANDLLRRNSRLSHGAWAIVNMGPDDYLGCLATQALETMQPEEFRAACLVTCLAADDLEKQFGTDTF